VRPIGKAPAMPPSAADAAGYKTRPDVGMHKNIPAIDPVDDGRGMYKNMPSHRDAMRAKFVHPPERGGETGLKGEITPKASFEYDRPKVQSELPMGKVFPKVEVSEFKKADVGEVPMGKFFVPGEGPQGAKGFAKYEGVDGEAIGGGAPTPQKIPAGPGVPGGEVSAVFAKQPPPEASQKKGKVEYEWKVEEGEGAVPRSGPAFRRGDVVAGDGEDQLGPQPEPPDLPAQGGLSLPGAGAMMDESEEGDEGEEIVMRPAEFSPGPLQSTGPTLPGGEVMTEDEEDPPVQAMPGAEKMGIVLEELPAPAGGEKGIIIDNLPAPEAGEAIKGDGAPAGGEEGIIIDNQPAPEAAEGIKGSSLPGGGAMMEEDEGEEIVARPAEFTPQPEQSAGSTLPGGDAMMEDEEEEIMAMPGVAKGMNPEPTSPVIPGAELLGDLPGDTTPPGPVY